MPLLTYARKILDKAKKFFEPPAQDIEADLAKRFIHFQRLEENCEQVLATLKTKGWLIIEQVIVDTIDLNIQNLVYGEQKSLEEVNRIKGNIESLSRFLSAIDEIDITQTQAKDELVALRTYARKGVE